MTRPSRNCGCINESLSMSTVSLLVSMTMMEKIMVVAPTTAVPMSTGFAVALNVLPAPSFASRKSFPLENEGRNPKSRCTSSSIPGSVSIVNSSNTDCALSVTGPYESTAIVTGPMPRKPNATRPNAKTAGASIISGGIEVLMTYPAPIKTRIVSPSQYALKLPAMKPERMLSDAPPSRDAVTTSRTCRESVEVNTFTNSGMMAPAAVPQVMTNDNFHHSDGSPPMSGISIFESMNVRMIEMIEVSQTREVSGVSKFIFAAFSYLLFAKAPLTK